MTLSSLPGRNDPCTCGSGQKFKKCCMNKEFQGPIREVKRSKTSKGMLGALLGLAFSMSNEEYFRR